jgi:pyruvate/2-oxoglutarate dehydrogenase complex dihydrolipoamide dehydrogenase (E3) component
MSEQFDAVVIGAGIAGETCARRLTDAGMRVGLVEREKIGGECAYWAHFPSKTVFGPTPAKRHVEQLANVDSLAPGEAEDLVLGDSLRSTQDEEVEAEALQHAGITIIRGDARLLGSGQIRVGDRLLQTPHCIIATGSTPRVPQIAGLAKVTYWTSREALSYKALPQRVVVMGGEAQAIELAETLRHSSAEVTLITKANRLMSHEDSDIGKHMAEHLYHYGVRVLLGSALRQVTDNGNGDYIITLDNEEIIHTQALVLAGSRTPRVEVLTDTSGSVQVSEQGIVVDEQCRAGPGIWAIGDVTGVLPLSHLAQYQAHLAADDILGHAHPARYLSVPRLYLTEPQIAATGLTLEQMKEQHIDISSVMVELNSSVSHPSARLSQERGILTLHADRQRGVLVGAWVIAPDAGEWIHLAVLAISASVPVRILHDTLEQLPGLSEPYRVALDQLIRE